MMDQEQRELIRGLAQEAQEAGELLTIAPTRVLELIRLLEMTENALGLFETLWAGVWMARTVRWMYGIRKGGDGGMLRELVEVLREAREDGGVLQALRAWWSTVRGQMTADTVVECDQVTYSSGTLYRIKVAEAN